MHDDGKTWSEADARTRRNRALVAVARVVLAILKGAALVIVALFAAVFGAAMQQNPPRRR